MAVRLRFQMSAAMLALVLAGSSTALADEASDAVVADGAQPVTVVAVEGDSAPVETSAASSTEPVEPVAEVAAEVAGPVSVEVGDPVDTATADVPNVSGEATVPAGEAEDAGQTDTTASASGGIGGPSDEGAGSLPGDAAPVDGVDADGEDGDVPAADAGQIDAGSVVETAPDGELATDASPDGSVSEDGTVAEPDEATGLDETDLEISEGAVVPTGDGGAEAPAATSDTVLLDEGTSEAGLGQDSSDAEEQLAAGDEGLVDNGEPETAVTEDAVPAENGIALLADEGLPPETGTPNTWVQGDNGSWYWYDGNGNRADKGWLVTDVALSGSTSAGLQRYWLGDGGALTLSGLITDAAAGWTAYATGNGYVVRGSWTDTSTGYVYLANNDGMLEQAGWLVTDIYSSSGLQRYWISADSRACEPGYSAEGWDHYTTPEGYVARGSYTDPSTGYVYLANNDGKLESPGWLVTSAYSSDGQLQRYWVDPDSHACEPGYSEDGWAHYTTDKGYVLRGALETSGKKYYADNDGKLASGWLVTGDFTDGILQRYWFADGAAVSSRLVGPSEGDASGYYAYATSDGTILRGIWDNGAGRVYLADNDGRLLGGLTGGWVVTGDFTGGILQRYYIDPDDHAARSGFFEVTADESPELNGTFWGEGNAGYVLRNDVVKIGTRWYQADNEGLLAYLIRSIIALDPGHGGEDGGAGGLSGIVESDINWKIAEACRQKLAELGIEVVLTRNENENVSIAERVERAQAAGATVIISLHNNSSDSASANGAEVLIPNESSYNYYLHNEGADLAEEVLTNLEALGLNIRGTVERDYPREGDEPQSVYEDGSTADYYGIIRYARQNDMLGVIIEHAFVTNPSDASKLADDAFLTQLGIADAYAIYAQYGTDPNEPDTPIMGKTTATVEKMVQYFEESGGSYPEIYAEKGAATITDFCQQLVEASESEGVRAEVVFCQAMLETGWLSFTGLVQAEQCNFAGIGATGNLHDETHGLGYAFETVKEGLLAQAQHLKAYASTVALNTELVDPRFSYVTRGVAPCVEDLSGRWATGSSGIGYGINIARMMEKLESL